MDEFRHPEYVPCSFDWLKWRLTYESGRAFRDTYLKKLSSRESVTDFDARKDITYVPAFAKAAVEDVKNSIFQRLSDVSRAGGHKTYQAAVKGQNGGVDRHGSTMDAFMGLQVLPELLTMKRVGVYVDMPANIGPTLKDSSGAQPYLYLYPIEDIYNYSFDNEWNLTALLLRDHSYSFNPDLGLPISMETSFRLLQLLPNGQGVRVSFFDKTSKPTKSTILDLTKIPFIMFEISDSILKDAADYQIALMNMESSDITYAIQSNFPFYTEQTDPRVTSSHLKTEGEDAETKTIEVGSMQGRTYPKGAERPGFIHPSSEPLRVSMEKEQQLKNDIRQIINLAIANMQVKNASAEARQFDERSLEAGLSCIGLALQLGENQIAECWHDYVGAENEEKPTISYPKKYSLTTDKDRRENADQTVKLMPAVPSKTYRQEVAKLVANHLLSGRIEASKLEAIYKEIDKSPTTDSDPKNIKSDVELGLVTRETASQLRGYPDGEVAKAKAEHAERLALIQKSQTPATGVQDTQTDPNASKDQKKLAEDPTLNADPAQKRGKANG